MLIEGTEPMNFISKMVRGHESLQIANLQQERLERNNERQGIVPKQTIITNNQQLLAFVANMGNNPFENKPVFYDTEAA